MILAYSLCGNKLTEVSGFFFFFFFFLYSFDAQVARDLGMDNFSEKIRLIANSKIRLQTSSHKTNVGFEVFMLVGKWTLELTVPPWFTGFEQLP